MSYQSEIWKTVGEGGRWKPEEVRQALPSMSAERVKNALWQMVELGHITRFEDGRFGVTHDCTIPLGMTVAEVLEVTGSK